MTHGEMEEFKLDGYSVAHESPVKAHEKDFEGITFIVESPKENGEVTAEHIRPEQKSTESYLERFAGWDEDIAQVINSYYSLRKGVEEFNCPDGPGRMESGMSFTKIVDEIFEIDLPDNFKGFMGIYNNKLEIHSIWHPNSLELDVLFENIVNKASEQGLDEIVFETQDVDEFESLLKDFDFETVVTEETRWGDKYTKLYAELKV